MHLDEFLFEFKHFYALRHILIRIQIFLCPLTKSYSISNMFIQVQILLCLLFTRYYLNSNIFIRIQRFPFVSNIVMLFSNFLFEIKKICLLTKYYSNSNMFIRIQKFLRSYTKFYPNLNIFIIMLLSNFLF